MVPMHCFVVNPILNVKAPSLIIYLFRKSGIYMSLCGLSAVHHLPIPRVYVSAKGVGTYLCPPPPQNLSIRY